VHSRECWHARIRAGGSYVNDGDTKHSHDAEMGPLELSVKDKETVNIPQWAGIGAIVI